MSYAKNLSVAVLSFAAATMAYAAESDDQVQQTEALKTLDTKGYKVTDMNVPEEFYKLKRGTYTIINKFGQAPVVTAPCQVNVSPTYYGRSVLTTNCIFLPSHK